MTESEMEELRAGRNAVFVSAVLKREDPLHRQELLMLPLWPGQPSPKAAEPQIIPPGFWSALVRGKNDDRWRMALVFAEDARRDEAMPPVRIDPLKGHLSQLLLNEAAQVRAELAAVLGFHGEAVSFAYLKAGAIEPAAQLVVPLSWGIVKGEVMLYALEQNAQKKPGDLGKLKCFKAAGIVRPTLAPARPKAVVVWDRAYSRYALRVPAADEIAPLRLR